MERKCIPLLVALRCDITERKDMAAVRHSAPVNGALVTWMVTREDIISG